MVVKTKMENYSSAYVYTQEDYYKNPKEFFKFLKALLVKRMTKGRKYSILDIGCSRGELLYYLKTQGAGQSWAGVDYSQTLIDMAKNFPGLNGVEFSCDRAESFSLKKKFDFVILAGVLSFFDDIAVPLRNLAKHLNKGGRAFVTSIINPYDVDAYITHRNRYNGNKMERGWNVISMTTLKEELKKLGMEVRAVHKFDLPFDLSPREDPMRSWTVTLNGEKKFMIGLGLVYDMVSVEIGYKDATGD